MARKRSFLRLPLIALGATAGVSAARYLRARRAPKPGPIPPDYTGSRPSSGQFESAEYDEGGTAAGDPLAGVTASGEPPQTDRE